MMVDIPGLWRMRAFTWQSIRVKMLAGLCLIGLPLIAFLIYTNVYAIDVVRNQVAKSNKDLLSLYRDQIDSKLKEVDNYLMGLMTDSDLSDLEFVKSHEARALAKQRVFSNLSHSILRFPVMDGFFIYLPSEDHYLYAFAERSTMIDRMYVKSYVTETVSKNPLMDQQESRKWYIRKNGDQVYLVRHFILNNASVVGAWINVRYFQTPLDLLGIGETGAALLGDAQGTAIVNQSFVQEHGVEIRTNASSYYLTGDNRRFLAVGEPSIQGDFSLYAFIPEEQILQHLPTLSAIAYFLPFGAVIILLFGFLLLRKTLLLPLNRLLKAMNRIRQGNLDTQIKQYPTSIEFRLVNDTFNIMMQQIKDLRISVYEEQLKKQKAELQHLQLQIKPHFFINTLNMMHMLARAKDVKRMEEMSLCLVRYFRYMFQSNLTFVALRDELQHVRNYLRIQELRFPDQLKYDIQAPEFLLRTPVPPLVIHTFVENAIKHAVTLDEPVWIHVVLTMNESPDSGLRIQVRDTGPGFRDGIVAKVESEERIVDEEGEHIGIWNLRQRLRLLYQDEARIELRNASPTGAVVELTLPFSLEYGTTQPRGETTQ